VLVYRPLGLGDFLTGVPAYRAIAATYEDHDVVLAAPAELRPLATLCGAIDRVLPTGQLEVPRWEGPPPAVAVNLNGRGPQSHEAVGAVHPRALIAYDAPGESGGPTWSADDHEVMRWCRLLAEHRIDCPPDNLYLDVPGRDSPAPGAVVVHPGAADLRRRWPPWRFGDVVRHLSAGGADVVVTGTAAERDLAEEVARYGGLAAERVLAGSTALDELAALVAHACVLISGDTGVAHLATAYGTPSVTLFGPIAPSRWGPPAGRPEHRALWHPWVPGVSSGDRPDPRLLDIGVDEVLVAVRGAVEHDRRQLAMATAGPRRRRAGD
jgi:ADP-heptose:LPS heptosyltransferase